MRAFALATLLALAHAVRAEDVATIDVDATRVKGDVKRELLGTEIKCSQGGQGLMTGLHGAKNEMRADLLEWSGRLAPGFMRYKFMRNDWDWTDGVGPAPAFRFTFPAHSATAIVLTRKR